MSDTTPPRERIVEAADRLFAEHGFAATSIADVAAAAQLLKGNLAYYFKTKQEVFDAVLLARQQRLWRELTQGLALDADAKTAITRLLAQVRSQADHLARFGCPIGSLSTELGKTGTRLPSPAARPLVELEDYLRFQFGRVMQVGVARECAEHLLALLQGAAVVAQARRDPSVVRRQVDAASVWLDNVLAQAVRLQGHTSQSAV